MSRTIYDVEVMMDFDGSCALGNTGGYFVRGHVSKLDLLCAIGWAGYGVEGRNLKVRQVWWRDVPASILDPGFEPCETGEEPILYDQCRPDAVGAYPVTVLHL